MQCRPQVVRQSNHVTKPKVSVILIDWGVRESFHSLEYLNRQTTRRDDYELIWLEFYDRKPDALQRMVAGADHILDKWYVLGYPDDVIFHKHRVYNAGILAARGEVCVICDSDAIFRATFIESLIQAFEETPGAVVHLDEVRNYERRFYPFAYPEIQDILGSGCVNWNGTTTTGLVAQDRIHGANYGACLAARRRDLLAIGGADEHVDYLGYVCGPYDLTFRLANYHGRPERWLLDEYLYHVWHPNTSGSNSDYHGPHDGLYMSLRALHARASFRVRPYLKNPWVRRDWRGRTPSIEAFLNYLQSRPEPAWKIDDQPKETDDVYWVDRDYLGYNIFSHRGTWYALPERVFHPSRAGAGGYPSLLQAKTLYEIHAEIHRCGPAPAGRQSWADPLRRLPVRAWRKSRRLLASLWPERRPW